LDERSPTALQERRELVRIIRVPRGQRRTVLDDVARRPQDAMSGIRLPNGQPVGSWECYTEEAQGRFMSCDL